MFRTLRFYHSFLNFYPRPPRGATQDQIHHLWRGGLFYPPSARRATYLRPDDLGPFCNFYPRPPRGGRPGKPFVNPPRQQPYFYPRPPRGGRLLPHEPFGQRLKFSIHALREEGDPSPLRYVALCLNFYPRPPRGGRPAWEAEGTDPQPISIHALLARWQAKQAYFYPRPPRGGRRR